MSAAAFRVRLSDGTSYVTWGFRDLAAARAHFLGGGLNVRIHPEDLVVMEVTEEPQGEGRTA